MEAGRSLHRSIGQRLAAEGSFEVRLRRDGVAARIDLLADVPVEIKSGEDPLPDDLVTDRPEYVEQMALYCALLGVPSARLVHVQQGTGAPRDVRAFDVAFADVGRLRSELSSRAERLRSALDHQTPEELPRCRWFRAGCEFRTASLCTCTGDEPAPGATIVEEVVGVVARGDVEARWRTTLAPAEIPENRPVARRYRDLVYPRRAYFEITEPVEASEAPKVRPADHPPSYVYDAAVGAVESGPAGEVCRMPERLPSPEEELVGWRGEPFLLRTSRAWTRVRLEELPQRFPQYVTELGFRCAVAGSPRGLLVIAYERATSPDDRLQVVEFSFGSGLADYLGLYRERTAQLAEGLSRHAPDGLPACPGWMTADCPYRERCGCPSEAGRSQR